MATLRMLLLPAFLLLAGCANAGAPLEGQDLAAPQAAPPRLNEAVSVRVWARG